MQPQWPLALMWSADRSQPQGRALPGKAPGFHVLKGQIRPFKPRGLPGELLPPPDNDVAAQLTDIATEEAMRPKNPQIARAWNGEALQAVHRKLVHAPGFLALLSSGLVQDEVDLAERKPVNSMLLNRSSTSPF
jgi:hypothetical protein